jgi:hypothetical protein
VSRSSGSAGRDLGDFLAEGGAVVGGGAAFGAAIGFIAGSLANDVDPRADPDVWARKGAAWGGLAGLVALVERAVQ